MLPAIESMEIATWEGHLVARVGRLAIAFDSQGRIEVALERADEGAPLVAGRHDGRSRYRAKLARMRAELAVVRATERAIERASQQAAEAIRELAGMGGDLAELAATCERTIAAGQAAVFPRGLLALPAMVAAPLPLTPRELEVIALVADGHTNLEIGDRLGATASTIKFHVANIVDKLEARDRTHAAVLYTRREIARA